MLFFAELRFDPKDPTTPEAIGSCFEEGMPRRFSTRPGRKLVPLDRAELLKLREIGSDLEGHPTPRLPFVDVATGLARPGHLRGCRQCAQRAPYLVRLPHLLPAWRRRVC